MAARARTVLIALCVMAALAGCPAALAGCSGSNPSPGPDLGASISAGPPSPAALRRVVTAARAILTQRAVVSVRLAASEALGAAGQVVTGGGQFDLGGSRGRVELAQVTGPERVIFLPESVFVAQSGGSALLPKGKVWISAGLTEQSLATNFPQFVTQVESLNPALLLSEVAAGSVSAAPLAPVGTDPAYSVVVDLAKAQSGMSGPSAAAFARAAGDQITEQSGGSSPTLTVEIVLDRQGRIVVMRGSPPGAGMGTVTLALSGWGVAVSVSQPPRAQVVDISSLAPGGERENAGGGDSDGA